MNPSRKIIVTALLASAAMAGELKVDINRDTKNNDNYTETGYIKWSQGSYDGATSANGTTPIYRSFTTADGESVTISFAQTAASQSAGGEGIENLYNGTAVSGTLDLIGDGLTVAPRTFAGGGQLQMTITGLNAGEHTLLTYHNGADGGWDTQTLGPIDVYVNNIWAVTNLAQTVNAADNALAAGSYVTFTVTDTNDVATILFAANLTAGSYTIRNPMVNGFEIDTPNIFESATNPDPADEDWHVDADSGWVTLSWQPALAPDTASHNIYFGTNYNTLRNADTNSPAFLDNQTATTLDVAVDDLQATYFWRVDEVSTANDVSLGTVWSFRPRHLAFPGAEGYGRFARGGRGGKTVHVTSLADYSSADAPLPGTLRYAIEEESGPRVIVFDVGGMITLTEKLTLSDDFVTVAGQTAPGKGICIRQYPFGLSGANDAVIRFIRNRPGDISGTTIDGGGLAGCDSSIMDHCSISWSIDEAFSGRSAHNITLQNTLISEALNIAGHQNYAPGTEHGYAATISGDIGSYHHNLLAHCSGRNWSLGGGLDADGEFAGRLDIRNNVVYNWHSRTTDGGAHEVNFVNNYYKPGAASSIFTALNPTYDNFPGTQQYYMSGNVMPDYFDETSQQDGRTVAGSNGGSVPSDYPVWVAAPFFEPHIETQSAEAAYKRVLSNVGSNLPLDSHDVRVIQETLNGTHTYTGTGDFGGYPGLPNSQDDVGGWEAYAEEIRSADSDSDLDGLPDWWEETAGTDQHSPSGDFSDATADPENDGYTRLDDYLAWMALPRLWTPPETPIDIDLTPLTAGYTANPVFTITNTLSGSAAILADGHTARFTPAAEFNGHTEFSFLVTDDDGDSMVGTIGVRVGPLLPERSTLGIEVSANGMYYTLYGKPNTTVSLRYSSDIFATRWSILNPVTASGNIQIFDLPEALSDWPNLFIRVYE